MKHALKTLLISLAASTYLLAGGGAAPVKTDVASIYNVEWQVAIKAGTLGLGLDIVRPFNDEFAARLNINGLRIHDYKIDLRKQTKTDIKGVDTTTDIDLLTVGVLLDWHPFHNGFLLSAGAYYNANKLSVIGNVKDKITYEGTEYTNNDITRIVSNMALNPISPYAGIGYSNITENGWGFSWDVGMMYHGTPKITTKLEGPGKDDPDIVDERIRGDKRANAEIAKHSILNFYPVVRVGLRYSF